MPNRRDIPATDEPESYDRTCFPAQRRDADTLFDLQRYHGGALVLYALRQVVGAATFQRIERAWVQRYEGQSASTGDFIALASQVSGRNLTGFLRDWLYGTKTPPMPGHPDWKVDPIVQNQPQALSVPVPPPGPRLALPYPQLDAPFASRIGP